MRQTVHERGLAAHDSDSRWEVRPGGGQAVDPRDGRIVRCAQSLLPARRAGGSLAPLMRAPRLIGLVALAGLIASLCVPTASGRHGDHKYVAEGADASDVLYKPRNWTPTGDGSLRFTKIRWKSYDGRVARATATAHSSSCEPSCADGDVTVKRVTITLDKAKTFECATDTLVYSRLRFKPSLPNRPSTIRFTYCSNRFG